MLNRQLDQLNHWSRSSGSELKQNVLLEQFLQSLPTDLAVKLRERKPTSVKEVAGWADEYDQAHQEQEQTGSQVKQPAAPALSDEAHLPRRPSPRRGTPRGGQGELLEAPSGARPTLKESCSVSSVVNGDILQLSGLKNSPPVLKQMLNQPY